MPTFSPLLEWAVGITTLLVMGALIRWIVELVPRGRLIRCPQTGTMAFVEIGRASRADGREPKVIVEACDLWPEQYRCKGRCLVGRKWRPWHKWDEIEICDPGDRHRATSLSLETCI